MGVGVEGGGVPKAVRGLDTWSGTTGSPDVHPRAVKTQVVDKPGGGRSVARSEIESASAPLALWLH